MGIGDGALKSERATRPPLRQYSPGPQQGGARMRPDDANACAGLPAMALARGLYTAGSEVSRGALQNGGVLPWGFLNKWKVSAKSVGGGRNGMASQSVAAGCHHLKKKKVVRKLEVRAGTAPARIP